MSNGSTLIIFVICLWQLSISAAQLAPHVALRAGTTLRGKLAPISAETVLAVTSICCTNILSCVFDVFVLFLFVFDEIMESVLCEDVRIFCQERKNKVQGRWMVFFSLSVLLELFYF